MPKKIPKKPAKPKRTPMPERAKRQLAATISQLVKAESLEASLRQNLEAAVIRRKSLEAVQDELADLFLPEGMPLQKAFDKNYKGLRDLAQQPPKD